MSNATTSRITSLTAAIAVTASLLFGITGIAHAGARAAATTVAAVASASTQS